MFESNEAYQTTFNRIIRLIWAKILCAAFKSLFKNNSWTQHTFYHKLIWWSWEGNIHGLHWNETCCHHRWLDFRYQLWFNLVMENITTWVTSNDPKISSLSYLTDFHVWNVYYHPQQSWGKVIFSQASVILLTGGACVVAARGHAWLLWGGMCGCSRGVRGYAWLLWGDVCGCSWGACMVAPRGVCGCSGGGMHGCSEGACVVAPRGACVVAPRGACMVALGGMHGCSWGVHGIRQDMEIRSMSGQYTSYWNAFSSITKNSANLC